jgi:hypothetical protein
MELVMTDPYNPQDRPGDYPIEWSELFDGDPESTLDRFRFLGLCDLTQPDDLLRDPARLFESLHMDPIPAGETTWSDHVLGAFAGFHPDIYLLQVGQAQARQEAVQPPTRDDAVPGRRYWLWISLALIGLLVILWALIIMMPPGSMQQDDNGFNPPSSQGGLPFEHSNPAIGPAGIPLTEKQQA